jgi:hypothetical protein
MCHDPLLPSLLVADTDAATLSSGRTLCNNLYIWWRVERMLWPSGDPALLKAQLGSSLGG